MEHLLKTCEKYLFSYVIRDEDPDGFFLDTLVFANKHGLEELEDKTVKFLAG